MITVDHDRAAAGPSWRSVFTAARIIAALAILLLFVIAILGRISWVESVAAVALILVSTVVVERAWAANRTADTVVEVNPALDPAVEAFANVLSEPCIVINERTSVVYYNPAARAQYPRLRLGEPLTFTLRDPDIIETIARTRRSGVAESAEIRQTVPNETWFRLSVAPLAAGPGDSGLLLLSLTDLTEQRRTDQLRADFVANASHELRTPLTSLMGFIETLQGPAARDEAARTRFLGIMRNQSERMKALIDDLLSLSRIEQRQHLRPTARIPLNPLLREVAESMELRARAENLRIVLTLPEDDVIVIGERIELYEVFENLIDNAIKYGVGGETVDVSLEVGTPETRGAHRLVVLDHGPGIAEEHVPRLTERFYRVEGEAGRKRKGTGLGLAIVKHVVSRHQGHLAIRSKLGEGTRVEVLFPGA